MTHQETNRILEVNPCPEFPYFGARYPDATCIDGYLWDLDSYDDGKLYSGGDDPCPFCNATEYIKQHHDPDPIYGVSVRQIKAWIKKLYETHNYTTKQSADE